MATKRLKQWVPQVSPDSPAHIDAYLLCRCRSERVRLASVLAAIKEQENIMERRASQDAVFWVVPKSASVRGLPHDVTQWLVTQDELRERYELPDDGADYSSVYCFSDACPRVALGKWVNQLKFSLKVGRSTRGKAEVEEPTPAAMAPSENDAGGNAQQAPPLSSAAASSSAMDAGEVPVGKTPRADRRAWVKQVSGTSSDEDERTLEVIVRQCESAGRI